MDINKSTNLSLALIKGSGKSFLVKVISMGVLFGTQIALARMLGAKSYGNYVYVLTWINLIAIIGKFGLDTSSLRYIPKYQSQQRWRLLRGFLRYSNRIQVAASVAASIVAVIIILVISNNVSNELTKTAIYGCLLLPIIVHIQVRGAYLQAFKHMILHQGPELIIQPIVLIAIVFLIYKLNDNVARAPNAILSGLVSTALIAIVLYLFCKKVFPKHLSEYKADYKMLEWTKLSFTFLLLSGFQLLLLQTDIIMLGYYVGTKEAGLYVAASKIVKLVTVGLFAINTMAAPIISQCHSLGQKNELQKIISLAARGGFLYSLPVGLVIAIFGNKILKLYGAAFVVAYIPLLIMISGRVIDSMTGLVGYLMMLTNHHTASIKIYGATVVLNIGMNILLIPIYGMNGAAVSTALSMIAWNVISVIYVKRKLGMNPTVLSFLDYKNS